MKIAKNFIGTAIIGFLVWFGQLFGPGFAPKNSLDPVSTGIPARNPTVEQKLLPASDAVKAQGYLLRGDYREVEDLLSDKLLSQNSVVPLIKAELSLGNNIRALILINRYRANPMARELFGLYLANQGDYPNARKNLAKYVELGPVNNQESQVYVCQILLKQGQLLQAAELLQKLDGSRSDVMLVKGDLALLQHNYHQAWVLYRQVLAEGYFIADSNFLAKVAITGIAADEDWLYLVDQIRQHDPHSGLADYVESQAYLYRGDLPGALAKLQSSLSQHLPERLHQQAISQSNELSVRAQADSAIQAVVKQMGS